MPTPVGEYFAYDRSDEKDPDELHKKMMDACNYIIERDERLDRENRFYRKKMALDDALRNLRHNQKIYQKKEASKLK